MRKRIARLLKPGTTARGAYAWNLAASVAQAAESFVMLFVATRMAGVEAAGVLAFALAIGQQLLCVGRWGMQNYQTVDVEERHRFSDYVASRFVTGGAMLAAGTVWAFRAGGGREKMMLVLLMVVLKTLWAFSTLFSGRYRQKLRIDTSGRAELVKVGGELVVFVVTCAVTHSVLAAMWAATATFLLLMLATDGALLPEFGGFSVQTTVRAQAALLWACLPLFANTFLQMYINNAQKFAIEDQMGDAAQGVYGILSMVSFGILLLSSSVLMPVVAPAAKAYEEGRPEVFRRIILRQFALLVGLGVAVLAGGWAVGVPVLEVVFKVPLEGMRTPLCLLLGGGVLLATYNVMQIMLIVWRRQVACLVGIGLASLFSFIFARRFVAASGLFGAAQSYLCAMGVLVVATALVMLWLRASGRVRTVPSKIP